MTKTIEQEFMSSVVPNRTDCAFKAKCMAKATINAMFDWHKEESALSSVDIDKLLDCMKIMHIACELESMGTKSAK